MLDTIDDWELVSKRRPTIALAVACSGSSRMARAQADLPPERIAALDARLPALLSQYRIATVGAGIVRAGRIAWIGVYGEQAPGVPASTETLG
jgi:hypothetical protein